MSAQKKLTPIHEAKLRCQEARTALAEIGARCIEATDDKCGIVWERWVLVKQVEPMREAAFTFVLYATPHGWDVFSPLVNSNLTKDTLDAIKALAK